MINIYQVDTKYYNWHIYGLQCENNNIDISLNHFYSLASIWTPLSVNLSNKNMPPVDNIGNISGLLIFSKRVLERIGQQIVPYGEFLPTICSDAELYIFNVTNGLQTFETSKLKFTDANFIAEYAFYNPIVKQQFIFKESSEISHNIYVTDRFVEAVIEAELTGFIFRRVWSEEQGSIAPQSPPIYDNNEQHRYVGSVEIIN